MPLINFKTNLTSLRFGMDQPGGGDSGQPFIQAPIETVNTPTNFKDFYERNRTSLDYPIRGGVISSLVNGASTTTAAVIDADRIKKFFKSEPRGAAFISKQKGLQLSNPRTQVPNSLQFVGLGIGNAVIPVTQVYDPRNTIAQVGVQGTGTHYNRHGVSPTIYQPIQATYQYVVGAPANNREGTNRLSILRALKLVGSRNFLVSPDATLAAGVDPALVDRLGISTIQNQLFNYSGGPGSLYGDGFTRIFRYTDTDAAKANSTTGFTVYGTNQPYSAVAFTYQQLASQQTRTTNPSSPVQAKIQDFRSQTNLENPIIPYSVDNYQATNIITRLKIGSPGAPKSRVRYTDTTKTIGVDLLNAQGPFYYDSSKQLPWGQTENGVEVPTRDIIKFAFECIDNNNPDGASTAALIFRAFLEGQISDTNQASYNTFKYLGRGETFRTYQGFDRSISFSFKLYAQSRQEMRPMYQKLNQLISQVYPDYSTTYSLMRGNVVKLTIGDYLYRVPGFLENVNVSIDNGNTPWETVLDEYGLGEDDVRQLPHMVTVQCSFKPIMDILPRKVTTEHPYVPLIANNQEYLKSTSVTTRGLTLENAQAQINTANAEAKDLRNTLTEIQTELNTFLQAVVDETNQQAQQPQQ